MYDVLKEMIKPELLLLIPVLYLFGMALKKSAVSNKHIPWMLGIFGIALSIMYLISSSDINGWQNILTIMFAGITQGILTAGASVYVNQLIKQNQK